MPIILSNLFSIPRKRGWIAGKYRRPAADKSKAGLRGTGWFFCLGVIKLSFIKINKILGFPAVIPWRGLSLRNLKGILLGLLACCLLVFSCLWQPAYERFCSLKEEKLHWQQVLKLGVNDYPATIPDMDQLPGLIDQCCSGFLKSGVKVDSFNVERFGERSERGKGSRIDYALIRLRLQGQWPDILSSLQDLEKARGLSVRVEEVLLGERGGDTLLQIYYQTGNEEA